MNAGNMTEQKSAGKGHSYKWLTAAGFAVLVVGVLYWYSSTLPTGNVKMTDDKLAVMEVRLQNLENSTALYADRLTQLEKDAKANAHASADNAAAIAVHNNAVPIPAPDAAANPATTAVATAPAPAGDEAKRIETLEKELATLKAAVPMQDSEHIGHSIKLLSAFHRLSAKVMSGKPYADDLSAFENELGDTTTQNTPLTELATYSENGVPTQAELMAAFDNAVDQLGTAQAVPPVEAGAWDRFIFNLTHLVRVRRIDESAQGKDTDSVIGRASSHLDKGEIEAAFAEINSLPAQEKSAFSGWLKDVQIAIDTPGLIDQLEEQVLQQAFNNSAQAAAPETTPAAPGGIQ